MNDNFALLSPFFFAGGFYIYIKTNSSKVGKGLFLIMVFCSMLLFAAHTLASYFTGNGIEEATIYHLKYGLDGAGFSEYRWIIVTTITGLILGSIYLIWFIPKSINDRSFSLSSRLSWFFMLSISLLLNPASIDIYNLRSNSLISTEQLYSQISTDFYNYYRKPHIQKIENNHKNIIFIYAEGLERTYFDETLFPGLIKGIRELESKSTYFTNIKQVLGTGWTIGGITSSQCGIPLYTPSHGNSMSGMDQFLSSAVCIGDLLNDEGYHLNYMGGASLDFAGKGKMFKTHGFTDVLGREELLTKLENKDYKTGWGLYDDSLLDMVYNRFIELSETGLKFGIFTLTLDTHHPDGHPSKSCKDIKYLDGSNSILNAVACSDYLITKFIEKITKSPYANETIVVLVSDHLALRNTAFDLLQIKEEERRNLFMIIDPSANNHKEISSVGSTLDIGTTLLPFIGYTGNIGLGRNLLNVIEREEDRIYIHANLLKWRREISEFWAFPKIQNSLEINIDSNIARIDNRNFQIPILIELNDKLETTLKFQFDKNKSHKSLVQHRKALNVFTGNDSLNSEDLHDYVDMSNGNIYFILIDKCENVSELDKTLGEDGFCLMAGKGKKYSKIKKLDKNIIYTTNEIRQLLILD